MESWEIFFEHLDSALLETLWKKKQKKTSPEMDFMKDFNKRNRISAREQKSTFPCFSSISDFPSKLNFLFWIL